ncbi:MAG: YXWGXW repeat-containing protein [Terriglobales bacterium]
MKLNWIYGVLFATVLAIPASAQVSVYLGSAPPPLRYERRGPLPGPGYAWVDGYWAPNGHHYRWVAGRWDRPPYKAHIGIIPTMITTGKAGSCMKATGIMRITTGTTDTSAITSTVAA